MLTLWRLYRGWLALVTGYLFGSILVGDLAAKLASRGKEKAVDLREIGSGNPGSANAIVNLGKGWGALVVAGDIFKGVLAASAGKLILGPAGAYAASCGAVIGACFPIFANFRGGKGLAAAAGTSVLVFPAWIPMDLLLVGGLTKLTKSVATGSYIASAALGLAAITWWRKRLPNLWGTPPSAGLAAYGVLTWALITLKYATAPAHKGDRERAS